MMVYIHNVQQYNLLRKKQISDENSFVNQLNFLPPITGPNNDDKPWPSKINPYADVNNSKPHIFARIIDVNA